MQDVHAAALVDPRARLGEGVRVGPWSIVGPDVTLGDGVEIGPHVVVTGKTTIGPRTRLFPFAAVGGEPQDKSSAGEATELLIGADNVIREHVTIHAGTPRGGGATHVGDDNLIMNGSHIGHDCRVGSHCILAAFTGLAGHVVVEDHVVLGGYTGVHQFARIGESVMAAANAKVSKDCVPFSLIAGDRARLVGVNVVGLRRRGFDPETVRAIRQAFHVLFHSKLRFETALARVREEATGSPEVQRLVAFLEKSERGFTR
ncbi:MAG: acyl-ACP--UDP-N-acetylglucosamine O-acyltransferase [Deltaproteobacteria bacterium]|nr:acyl-ACP--UDP-N-acetylglucosamine O-acyltransferase [Deltaproteobacteria bacterium]